MDVKGYALLFKGKYENMISETDEFQKSERRERWTRACEREAWAERPKIGWSGAERGAGVAENGRAGVQRAAAGRGERVESAAHSPLQPMLQPNISLT